jgi:hypothetical protein
MDHRGQLAVTVTVTPASDGKSPGNWLDIRQLTDVSACKLQQYLSRNWHFSSASPSANGAS